MCFCCCSKKASHHEISFTSDSLFPFVSIFNAVLLHVVAKTMPCPRSQHYGCVYHHFSGIELRFPNDFQGDFCR